jgi:hypothetical protein
MKSESFLIASAALLFLAMPRVGAGDTASASPLAPLAFLAGHCWITTIDGGRETDTHCYEWMHDGMQLRDRHVVRGDKPDYRGETIYAYNGERKRVEYRYWNSIGGQSDGYLELAQDGTLKFLDDRYVGADGVPYVFASEITRPGDSKYRIVTRMKQGETWRELYGRVFERQAGPPAAP